MKIFWIVIVIVNGLHFETKHDNDDLAPMLKDVRANCLCATLLRR